MQDKRIDEFLSMLGTKTVDRSLWDKIALTGKIFVFDELIVVDAYLARRFAVIEGSTTGAAI